MPKRETHSEINTASFAAGLERNHWCISRTRSIFLARASGYFLYSCSESV